MSLVVPNLRPFVFVSRQRQSAALDHSSPVQDPTETIFEAAFSRLRPLILGLYRSSLILSLFNDERPAICRTLRACCLCIFGVHRSGNPSDYTQCARSDSGDKIFGYSDNIMSADLARKNHAAAGKLCSLFLASPEERFSPNLRSFYVRSSRCSPARNYPGKKSPEPNHRVFRLPLRADHT
jgi:hypothetical protein